MTTSKPYMNSMLSDRVDFVYESSGPEYDGPAYFGVPLDEETVKRFSEAKKPSAEVTDSSAAKRNIFRRGTGVAMRRVR